MLIRCEKCQALYSLQDGVVRGAQGEIPPSFKVECGRCLAQFEAEAPASLRPGSKNKTPVPPNSALSRGGKPKPSASTEQPMKGSPSSATLARALKPNRPVPDEDDAFAREMASIARRRKAMLWVAVVVLLAVIGVIAVPILRKRFASLPHAAKAKMEQANKKLLLDDLADLEQAADLDLQAMKLAPGEAAPEADRAFALLLAAGSHKDLADRSEARGAQLGDEVAKLQIAKPEGFEKQVDAIRTQLLQINDEREPHVRAANQLLQQGRQAALSALEKDADELAALRALALYGALNNAVDSGMSYIEHAENLAPGDALTTYVRAQLFLCGSPSREKQDRGLAQLALARQGSPHLLRALYDTASIEADRQLAPQARKKLDQLLEESPQHERAQRLRASLPPGA